MLATAGGAVKQGGAQGNHAISFLVLFAFNDPNDSIRSLSKICSNCCSTFQIFAVAFPDH